MFWIVGALIVGLLVYGVLPDRAYPNPLPTVAVFGGALDHLLAHGLEGATATVALRDAEEHAVVFRKYIRARKRGFIGTLSASGPAVDSLEAFTQDLRDRGVVFEGPRVDGPRRTVHIDFGKDIGLAQVFARLAFRHLYGASIERDCVVFFRKIVHIKAPHLTGTDHDPV